MSNRPFAHAGAGKKHRRRLTNWGFSGMLDMSNGSREGSVVEVCEMGVARVSPHILARD
jgi:hypothetical protein